MVKENLDEWAHTAKPRELQMLEVIETEIEKKSKLCLQCMKCCMSIGFPVYKPSKELGDFFMTRGAKMVDEGHDIIVFVYKNVCPHLDLLRGCKIYSTRPVVCRQFDGTKHNSTKEECLWKTLR